MCQCLGSGDVIAMGWRIQRFQPVAPFSFGSQWNAAGGEDAHAGRCLQDRLCHLGRAIDHMLRVVEHDQRLFAAQ
jgi:hypothetical protein